MAVTTSSFYKQKIYSGEAEHSLKLWINNVLQPNIEEKIEEITMTTRVFPNGSNTFNINELISREVEIILHDTPYNTITGQIKFSIGTYITSLSDYEYVPMGIYNIEEITDNENNKITIKLRDNSVKLDVPYNAKPLLDENDGQATLMQILTDICTTCGIEKRIVSFPNQNKRIGIYDNSINARIYINYIAGQAGLIPIINRDGYLTFIYPENLTTHLIPLNILQSYKLGEPYKISKVIYESGIIKYEAGADTYDTMYIDSANLYINTQEQVTAIYNRMNNFEIDSATTDDMMGDPAIDPYDLIQVYGYYDENDNFVDDTSTIVFTTFANQKFTYNGKCKTQYETIVSKEKRESNVSLKSEETYKKNVKTEIDLINGTLKLINEEYLDFLKTKTGQSYVTIEDVAQNGITKIKMTGDWYSKLYPANNLYPNTYLYPTENYIIIENTDTHEKYYYNINCDLVSDSDIYEYAYAYDDELKEFVAKAYYTNSNNVTTEVKAPEISLPTGNYKISDAIWGSLMNYEIEYIINNNLTGTLATNTQLSTAITQTRNEIDLQAKSLVNKDEILADINVAISEGKGKIKLTGNEVVIDSDKFKVYGDGTLVATNGVFKGTVTGSDITGARISIVDDFRADSLQSLYDNPSFHITSYEVYDDADHENNLYMTGSLFDMRDDIGGQVKITVGTGVGEIIVYGDVHADNFVRNSLEERKKNFEKFNNALKIINDTDIYKYHYKNEKDECKKNIGIVIGDKYKYSSEITNENNTGMNLTNMVGVCFQAIKEQQQMILELQKEIEKLKEDK